MKWAGVYPPSQARPRGVVRDAYRHCERIAREHYENFPVASALLPAAVRPHIAAIYAFARGADDLADEGTLAPQERLRRLDDWQRKLDECFAGSARDPVFIALAESAASAKLPRQPFDDLLTAFRMDVTTSRYRTFEDLLQYCNHSANPIGRLVLAVFGNATARTVSLSDSICTALQLTNFWQDVRMDLAKGRIYIPLEDLERFGYTENDLLKGIADRRLKDLMRFQVERTRALFMEGAPLLTEAVPPLRLELRLTWIAGQVILARITKAGYDVLSYRPSLSTFDKLTILVRTLAHRH